MFPQQYFLVFPGLKSSFSYFLMLMMIIRVIDLQKSLLGETFSSVNIFKQIYTYVGHPSPVKDENRVNMALGRESKLKTRFFHSRFLTFKTKD